MGLKIGQLAQLTQLSVETIRFYEKESIIHPKRAENSSYRYYDVWDVFALNEAIQFRSMGFSLKEVKDILQRDSLQEIDRRIAEKYREIESKIEYQHMLSRYLSSLHEKIASAQYNIGNYWVRKDPDIYYLPYCTRKNETYTDVDYSNETIRKWLKAAPFYEAQLHCGLINIEESMEEEMWSIYLERDYFEFLQMEMNDDVHVIQGGTYVHTIVDMGEKGELSINQLKPCLSYIREKGYTVNGTILGTILIKFHEQEKWHRYIELRIPVKI